MLPSEIPTAAIEGFIFMAIVAYILMGYAYLKSRGQV